MIKHTLAVSEMTRVGRSHSLQFLDYLEAVVMKKGWPVPFTKYYVVDHDSLIQAIDQLRLNIQERDQEERLIQAFGLNEKEATSSVSDEDSLLDELMPDEENDDALDKLIEAIEKAV